MPEFSLFGPAGARGPAGEVQLGGGVKLRIVLALLVLRAGQLVSRDALVDALWPEDPPRARGRPSSPTSHGCGGRCARRGSTRRSSQRRRATGWR